MALVPVSDRDQNSAATSSFCGPATEPACATASPRVAAEAESPINPSYLKCEMNLSFKSYRSSSEQKIGP